MQVNPSNTVEKLPLQHKMPDSLGKMLFLKQPKLYLAGFKKRSNMHTDNKNIQGNSKY